MKNGLHPKTLLLLAAICAACGEPGYGEDDDQTGDPSNAGGWDAGTAGGGTAGGSPDAGAGEGGMPWDARFDAGGGTTGGGTTGGGNNWDAGSTQDAAWSPAADGGSNDAAAGADAGWAEAGADASRADAGGTTDAGGNACTLTYENFGRQFLTNYCVGCHGAVGPRAGLRLDSLAGLSGRKVQAKAAVLGGAMPQGANRPSDADRQRFGQWIDCGPN